MSVLGLYSAAAIHSRKDLERWAKRANTRRRFLTTAYLFGAVPIYLMMVGTGIYAGLSQGGGFSIDILLKALVIGFFPAACCFGPIVLLPCYILFSTGMSNYHRVMKELEHQGRVCEACNAIALYDDKLIEPVKHRKHTQADLVPQMNVI